MELGADRGEGQGEAADGREEDQQAIAAAALLEQGVEIAKEGVEDDLDAARRDGCGGKEEQQRGGVEGRSPRG